MQRVSNEEKQRTRQPHDTERDCKHAPATTYHRRQAPLVQSQKAVKAAPPGSRSDRTAPWLSFAVAQVGVCDGTDATATRAAWCDRGCSTVWAACTPRSRASSRKTGSRTLRRNPTGRATTALKPSFGQQQAASAMSGHAALRYDALLLWVG